MSDARRHRSLPVLDTAATNATRIAGGLGVLTCVLCCISMPSVVAAISALGLGFLRNDRVLFPAEVVSLVVLIGTLLWSRRRHGRNAPLIAGLVAAGWTFWGIVSSVPLATIAALTGAGLVVLVVAWDWRLQRRCSA